MALSFLATHFLLILSAVSPDLHNAFFHSSTECSGQHAHHPCDSHDGEEEPKKASYCAVLLFSESSEPAPVFVFLPEAGSIECEIPLLDIVHLVTGDGNGPFGARGPPLSG